MKKYLVCIILLLLSPTLVHGADPTDELASIRAELESLKANQEKLQREIAELKAAAGKGDRPRQERPPFKPRELSVQNATVMGEDNAPVTLFVYSDFQCPFCQRYAQSIFPELIERYVETGQMRIVNREFPITRLHPQAMAASAAALCAGQQSKYLPMHDLLFTDRKNMRAEQIDAYATSLNLDMEQFRQCIEDEATEARILEDIDEARSQNISGTPSFVMGKTDLDNPDVVMGEVYLRGAGSPEAFRRAMNQLLNGGNEPNEGDPGES